MDDFKINLRLEFSILRRNTKHKPHLPKTLIIFCKRSRNHTKTTLTFSANDNLKY